MKFYVYNDGWCGVLACFADNKTDAIKLLKSKAIYETDINEDSVEETPIEYGVAIVNYGDQ